MNSVKIGDLVHVSGGGTPRRSNSSYYDGPIPWVTPKDMKRPLIDSSEVTITADGVANSPARLIAAGSILVVVRSGVLKHTLPVAVTGVPVTVNQDMKALTPSPGVDASYLGRRIKALEPLILGQVRATTADNFPIDTLLDIAINLPPLDEQRRIAAILDQADAVRAKRRRVLAHLDLLDDAVFRTVSSTVSNRQPIGALLSFRSGSFLPAKSQESGGVRVYGGNGITGYHSRFLFEDSKVVIGRVGAYCGVVHVTTPRSWITDNALYVHAVHADLKTEYLAAALTAANLNQYASQSGQPLISAGRIAAVEIPVPTAEQQNAFVANTRAIARQRDRVQSALAAESEMFMSLQSRAFRGDL